MSGGRFSVFHAPTLPYKKAGRTDLGKEEGAPRAMEWAAQPEPHG